MRESSALRPESAPPKAATLRLAGAAIPVVVRREPKGGEGRFLLLLSRQGRALDREGYRATPDAFAVTFAAGERYEPEIPLLRFPGRVGDAWNWAGRTFAQGQDEGLPATARVRTEEVKIPVEGSNRLGVRTVVEMELRTPSRPLRRILTFDFAPGYGVVGRAWGEESIRTAEGG
jgi:hypothetical protein